MSTVEELKKESLIKAHDFATTLNRDGKLINKVRIQSNKDKEGKEFQKFIFEFSDYAIALIVQKAIKDLYDISCAVQKTRATDLFLLHYDYPLYPTEAKSLFEQHEENSTLLSDHIKEKVALIIKKITEERENVMARENLFAILQRAPDLHTFFKGNPKPSSHKEITRTNSLETIAEDPVVIAATTGNTRNRSHSF